MLKSTFDCFCNDYVSPLKLRHCLAYIIVTGSRYNSQVGGTPRAGGGRGKKRTDQSADKFIESHKFGLNRLNLTYFIVFVVLIV